LTDPINKTKLLDPFILSLVKNIDKKRSSLTNLECIDINSSFSNIVSDNDGNDFYIKNQFHKAKGFRKLHLEIAQFSGNLKILHCVFFPDPLYEIPIFGLDIVKVNNFVSAAIVDLSPVSNSASNQYEEKMNKVKKEGFRSIRKIPDWGNIFSENVFFASLTNESEQNLFYEIVDQYLTILVEVSFKVLPDILNEKIQERISFQKKYCKQQMKNEKTSLVLQNYFDKSWVEKYIKEILFDFQ
tara:strand:- start:11938 stop:12663 length:726 start_codon:yes stop_codon:yes gene_type:complete